VTDVIHRNRGVIDPARLVDFEHPAETARGSARRPAAPAHRGEHHRRRSRVHWRRVVVLALVVGAITWGLTDDMTTQVRLHHTEVTVSNTQADVAATALELEDARDALFKLVAARTTDQAALNQVQGELSIATQRLAQAEQGLAAANQELANIKTCIAGTKNAFGAIEAGQQQAAITSIAGVAPACESLEPSGAGGPVYPFDFPDPDVIDVAGTFYAYGTNAAGGNVQIIDSTDLAHWSVVGDALPQLPAWARPGATWAPGVIQLGSGFVMFYATERGTTECISVATAAQPQGPFIDRSTQPLICQTSLGGSIDPAPYLSRSGSLYLTWKSNGGSGQPATIWAQPLSPTGTALATGSYPIAILRPTQAWEGNVVEGPFMWSWNGTYYLFYSGNNWDSASYAEGVAVCSGPLGPCSKPLGGPIYASQPSISGPGGASVFVDSHGTPWIAFHGWMPAAVGYPNARLLFVRELTFSNGIPVVVPPT
jgi:hypothetical protein